MISVVYQCVILFLRDEHDRHLSEHSVWILTDVALGRYSVSFTYYCKSSVFSECVPQVCPLHTEQSAYFDPTRWAIYNHPKPTIIDFL